jgi:hypothetical protein
MVLHLGSPRAIEALEYDRVTVARPVDLAAEGPQVRRMPLPVPSTKTTLTKSECSTECTQGRKPLIIAQSSGCFVSRCLWILNWTKGVNTCNGPNIAGQATFQMPAGSLSGLMVRLDNGFEDLLRLAHPGEARKDRRECELVHLLRERAAGVFHRDERETQPGALTQCALHTHVSGDAG